MDSSVGHPLLLFDTFPFLVPRHLTSPYVDLSVNEGQYRLQLRLGGGGFGDVYQGEKLN